MMTSTKCANDIDFTLHISLAVMVEGKQIMITYIFKWSLLNGWVDSGGYAAVMNQASWDELFTF